MNAIKEKIEEWKALLFAPNQSDVLWVLIENKNAVAIEDLYQEDNDFIIPDHTLLRKIYRQNEKNIKETGSSVFGFAQDVLVFSISEMHYRMPIFLAAAKLKKRHFDTSFLVNQIEDFTFNPLLFQLLNLNNSIENKEDLEVYLRTEQFPYSIETGLWATNYHPHRFVLQKEYDELLKVEQWSESLKELFGETSLKTKTELSRRNLFSSDESQRFAMNLVKNENLVIQGPPGTGKSQVIANLLGKNLAKDQLAVVIAEKPVALEVIYDKLLQNKLHHFAVLYHHELQSKHFVQSLQRTWHFLESLDNYVVQVGETAKLLTSGLELTLARLKQKELIGGVSYSDFTNNYKQEIKQSEIYLINKPTIPEWEKDYACFLQLIQDDFPLFGIWKQLKKININFGALQHELKAFENCIIDNNWSQLTKSEMLEKQRLGVLSALFFIDGIPIPEILYKENSKEQKRFIKIYKRLKTLYNRKEIYQEELNNWEKEFSKSELETYVSILSSKRKRSVYKYKIKRKIKRLSKIDLQSSIQSLTRLLLLKELSEEIILLKEDIRNLNIPDDWGVVSYIMLVIQKLKTVEENDLKYLYRITIEEKFKLSEETTKISKLLQQINTFFYINEADTIMSQVKALQSIIPQLVANQTVLFSISKESLSVLQKTSTLNDARSAVFHSHWTDFKGRFPELAKVSNLTIEDKIRLILKTEKEEQEQFTESIRQAIKKKFDSYHFLLQTPSRKLNEQEKHLKKTLKKGKAILVSAFGKKRVFPAVRTLLESEARIWIQLLHPIFLTSPYSLAKSVPIDYIFDLAVFDEASQIPLNHAVGGIQRAKRTVISGDQQQMAPQFYFEKKMVYTSDLLHHAQFYWKNIMLEHHYRSKDPRLIAYSNRYFYENKLHTYPSVQQEEPFQLITTNGVFENRINKKEAKIVADIVVSEVKAKNLNFGLVAFSQSQLQAILDLIPIEIQHKIASAKDVFVQSLENVQGDQCEHLIISMGYAKNKDGDFHKRFGPLNQEQGHRRLNVLMSRAISKISFIRSVTSDDFSISENIGVEMLRKLMRFLEEDKQLEKIYFQEGISKINAGNLRLDFIKYNNAEQVIDTYRTLSQRGWKIEVNI